MHDNMERLIVNTAKQVFIEKGFAETTMSDIAARAGINRPGLHYYFRTKEKMFDAVFKDIVYSIIPAIHDIIVQPLPIEKRIADAADVYFDVMRREPFLPLFVIREINRNAAFLVETVNKLGIGQYLVQIRNALQKEMEYGKIRQVPIEFVFYTFYGLLVMPYLTKPVIEIAFDMKRVDFDDLLQEWKSQFVRQLTSLLHL